MTTEKGQTVSVGSTGGLGGSAPTADQIADKLETCIASLCVALNDAHDEIIRLQNADPKQYDWPEWSGPANSIRAAEKLLGRKLAKTDAWTHFPTSSPPEPASQKT